VVVVDLHLPMPSEVMEEVHHLVLVELVVQVQVMEEEGVIMMGILLRRLDMLQVAEVVEDQMTIAHLSLAPLAK